MEHLSKATCVRCGKPVSTKGGRCATCLKKLRIAKKTPGTWQRSQTKADDSLRRQAGKNGTAHKKSKGLGTRKEIVDKIQSAEKKTGQKLSPDRKNNELGYTSSNVRAVPENLNRGRHKVDPKKLKRWQDTIKKSNVSAKDLNSLLILMSLEKGDKELAQMLEIAGENLIKSIIKE